MLCTICQRPSNSALPFNCTACARDTLYQTRFSLAHTLLGHEAAGSQVEQALRGSTSTRSQQSNAALSTIQSQPPLLTLESINVHREALRQQTQRTLRFSEQLQREAGKFKEEIAKRKARNLERRTELVAARKDLARREADDVGSLEKVIAKARSRWSTLHARTAESRWVLCKEAASLYGLRKQDKHGAKSKTAGYVIGGLLIYNVMDLNINSGTFPAYTSSSVRAGSRATHMNSPKPLYLKKHLPTIAKDDSQTYAAVVEGITLLAWDVAWLCRTQGFDVGAESWEEVCNVGENLGKLFAAERIEPRSTSSAHGPLPKRDTDPRRELPVATGSRAPRPGTASDPLTSFGQYSHGTVHSNLSTANGAQIMREWRLQDPAKVIERVKQVLVGDRTGAGWDMLEGKEWEVSSTTPEHSRPAAPVDAKIVLVDSTSSPKNIGKDLEAEPIMPGSEGSVEKAKGTSGWTKVKSR
ncbi:MAG: hypothetical protein Q9200_001795 [Gallowayella weberi]